MEIGWAIIWAFYPAFLLITSRCRPAATVDDSLDFRDDVANYRGGGGSAVKIRLTGQGVDYMNRLTADVIRRGAKRLRFPDVVVDLPLGGYARFYNVKVTGLTLDRSDVELTSPDRIRWSTKGADVELAGDGEGQVLLNEDRGQFTLDMDDVDIAITTTVRDDGGYARLALSDCRASVRRVDVKLSGMKRRAVQNMVNKNGKAVETRFKAAFQRETCAALRKAVERGLNKYIRDQPLKRPLSSMTDGIQSNDKNNAGSSFKKQIEDALTKLTFDCSQTEDPKVSSNMADLSMNGEISWMGSGGTPFSTGILNSGDAVRVYDKMVYTTISDFVINSMLYHAYKQKALDVRFDQKRTPEFGKLLRLQCDSPSGQICLGNILPPSVAKTYSDSDVSLTMTNVRAPGVLVQGDGATLLADPVLTMFASEKQVAKARLDARLQFNPIIDKNLIKGKVTVKKLTATLLESSVSELNQVQIDNLVELATIALESMINDELDVGFPIPTNKLLRMQNPSLRLQSRNFRLDTDVQADPDAVVDLVQNVLDRIY